MKFWRLCATLRLENPTNPSPTPFSLLITQPLPIRTGCCMKNSETSITSRDEHTKMLHSSEEGRNSIAWFTSHYTQAACNLHNVLFVWEREPVSFHDYLSLARGMCWTHTANSDTLHKVGNMTGFRLYLKQMLALKFRDLKEFNLSFPPKHLISQMCGKQESLSWSTKSYPVSP